MIEIYLRGAAGWAGAHALGLGAWIWLFVFIGARGHRDVARKFSFVVLGACAGSGLLLGGPLALAVLRGGALAGDAALGAGALGGAALGALEGLVLVLRVRRGSGAKRSPVGLTLAALAAQGTAAGLVAVWLASRVA